MAEVVIPRKLFKAILERIHRFVLPAMLINMPAVKVLYKVLVRRVRKNVSLIYNPVTSALDPRI